MGNENRYLAERIRVHCMSCSDIRRRNARVKCTADCPLADLCRRRYIDTTPNMLRDIRSKCLDCMGEQRSLVTTCQQSTCGLWPLRDSDSQIQFMSKRGNRKWQTG